MAVRAGGMDWKLGKLMWTWQMTWRTWTSLKPKTATLAFAQRWFGALRRGRECMTDDFDIIVIGSGAGGGTFAYACAREGKKTLLLERGRSYEPQESVHSEHAMLIEKEPYDDRPVAVNGVSRRLYMGGTLGGGTALYGAALMRPSADDFHPGRHYGERLPRHLWDWPIGYDDLEPYYSEAEALYSVSGAAEDDFGPLEKPRRFPHQPIPVKPINRKLMAANRARGLQPFRLPLAIDFDRCRECDSCPGFICPNGARRSSAHLVAKSAVQVRTNVEVERFSHDGRGQVDGVHVVDRGSGQREIYRARRYALAAGAIGSPSVLLRSGLDGPQVGRNYMMHVCPVVVGIFPGHTGADETYVKQVGFADFYHGTKEYAHKLGLVQSLPAPGPAMLAKVTSRHVPAAALRWLRKHMLPLTGIVEDLPDPANRVCLGTDGAAVLQHRFSPYDLERGRTLGRLMVKILRNAGALFCPAKSFPSEEHVAHQCGTLRCGADRNHAVVDADCRLFDQPNVFVVDGSVLPTSLGVGPALTIMANALRVAKIVSKET
jgi:choline dehydrogenase-like flavoprotein